MEPNKTIKLELTQFEARQLKEFTKYHKIHLLVLLNFAVLFVGIIGFAVLAILENQILLGFFGVFACAWGINEIFFTDTSAWNSMKALASIDKKL